MAVCCTLFLLSLLLPVSVRCRTMDSNGEEAGIITIGALVPDGHYSGFYYRMFDNIMEQFNQSTYPIFNFTRVYSNVRLKLAAIPTNSNPNEILKVLCNEFMTENITALIQLDNTEPHNKRFSSAEYFLQLANYVGVPVLSWNVANAGLEKKFRDSVVLHLAPSLVHQAKAMMSILIRYHWNFFFVVTSQVLGHTDFVQAIRHIVKEYEDRFDLKLVRAEALEDPKDTKLTLKQLKLLPIEESRVIILHCTEKEAILIFNVARKLNLTRNDFVWIVTQAVVLEKDSAPSAFPIGMLGLHFDSSILGVFDSFSVAFNVLGHGLEAFVNNPANGNISLSSPHSCLEPSEERWHTGVRLYHHLVGVDFMRFNESLSSESEDRILFNEDGTLKYSTLSVVNLDDSHRWTQVGKWQKGELHIQDIVWPGKSAYPPIGQPVNYHLRVTFLEEPPYVRMDMPDNKTGQCHDHGVMCRIPPVPPGRVDLTGVGTNETHYRCCSGFCVDLLRRLAQDLTFTFEMQRAEDGLWGAPLSNGSWNGLMAELIEHRADMAMTSLKINSNRENVVDFSLPFMDTGISVVVAKRTGIISPKAFLEPFDMISWFFILVVSLQAAAISIFVFEWLSPDGYDKKLLPVRGHNFSLFRTYWLVWAMLFGASVNVVGPRGYTARFMSNVWAGCSVFFLAIYTANLAAFMITREEFHNLEGVEDPRLMYPFSQKPPLIFGTIPYGNTYDILKNNFPDMHSYMKNYNRNTVQEGISAIKKRELDAFIYDSTVLEYLVGQDDECRLLTVGSWYAMTGYGIAFPRNSRQRLERVNQKLLNYKASGYLDRLTDFWLRGACQMRKGGTEELTSYSYVIIGPKQFTSAFLLLGCGLLLGLILLGMETFYFAHLRAPIARRQQRDNCCTLISLNLGRSLTFEEVVVEARDIHKYHKCKDPICDTILWKVRHQLDMARFQIKCQDHRIKKMDGELKELKQAPS